MLILTHLVSHGTDVWCSHVFGVCDPTGLGVCVQVYVYSSRSAGIGHCEVYFKGGRQLRILTGNCILVNGIPVAAPYIV